MNELYTNRNTASWLPAMYWIRATDTEGFIRTFKIVKF
jgi:hypothetical protein